MKRKEWLTVLLACVILAAVFLGLYFYRSAQGPAGTPTPPTATQPAASDEPQLLLRVTKDFGRETLLEKPISVKEGDTVMDILKRSGLEIKTGYGGGFVEEMAGLASQYRTGDPASKKLDWFFYVNGMMADVGAAEYPVQAGDVVWWDYHDWEYAIATPALVGAYPHPFLRGPGGEAPAPLVVMAAKGFEKQAEKLADQLKTVRPDVKEPIAWDEARFTEESAMILVGDGRALLPSKTVAELWRNKQTQGLFAEIRENGIQTYDQLGQPAAVYAEPGTGLVLGTVHAATRLPLWIVTGTDAAGVEKAINSLQLEGKPSLLSGNFGAVLTGESVVRLPVVDSGGGTP
jgi:hypothetical protein